MLFNQVSMKVGVASILLALTATQASAHQQEEDSYAYLRCNATSWQLADSNLLEDEGRNRLSLSYEVKQQWMIDAYDDCVLTVTDAKGQWTGETKDYVVKADEVTPGKRYRLVEASEAGKGNFRVKYKELGKHEILVNLKRKTLRIERDDEHHGNH